MSIDFKSINLRSFYSTTGLRILKEVINPLLQSSVSYDRLTGYFTAKSLTSVSAGLDSLYRTKGKMRLVIGIHDVDADLIAARTLGTLLPSDMVEHYKKRFLVEVGSLSEVTDKSAIAGIAWMLRLGLLEIRVAAPKNINGIYHQKRMIFRDANANVIAGTGSLNETIGGLYNVEEMQFSFSWKSNEDMTRELVDSFNEIWSGVAEEIDIIPLDDAFATTLLSQIGNPPNPFLVSSEKVETSSKALIDLVELARKSPSFAPFNLSQAALYPHQERVFTEALSRWPIRVMLADEVGLGKTLEGGVLISYLLRMNMAKSVTILCPAGLMRQWQDEMKRHFHLDFYCFDSGRNEYVSPDKARVSEHSGSEVNLKIISAQWARLNEDRFANVLPDLLLVDEAHAARVSIDQYGTKSTRLWKLLDAIKQDVPHIILMTATPMQVHPSEYHGLLKILGLPKQWEKFSNYEQSLKVIGEDTRSLALNEAKVVADLLLSAFGDYVWLPDMITNQESLLIMELRQAYKISKTAPAIRVQEKLADYILILTKIHPAHLLTCRNTKRGLERFGYKFPVRHFESPKISMNGVLERYELAVESYLTNAYGKTEESLKPAGRFPIGFAKSGYYQRLVSSLYASRSSLEKRKEKLGLLEAALGSSSSDVLQKLILNFDIEDDDVREDEYTNLRIDAPKGQELERVISNVKQSVKLETSYINELLEILAKMGQDIEMHDPKFAVALKILEEKTQDGSVLVFSRYTDTLEGFLKLFERQKIARSVPGFALYTGGAAWIQTTLGRHDAAKTEVTDALDAGKISVVFCSDAASEGLNLQTAKSLINLDVPWNPARLEQRIGRIARLGQKASKVEIFNLWYPESIEAKMYTRLLSRQEDYELAVGEAADIFSDAIKNEVATKFHSNVTKTDNQFVQLQNVREHFQRKALQKIWQREGSMPPASSLMREDILEALKHVENHSNKYDYSLELVSAPGTPKSFTLLHNGLNQLAKYGVLKSDKSAHDLCALLVDKVLIALCTLDESNCFHLINVMSLGRTIKAILGISPLGMQDFYSIDIKRSALTNSLHRFLEESSNIPNHNLANIPFEGIVSSCLNPRLEQLEIKKLCKVNVKFGA